MSIEDIKKKKLMELMRRYNQIEDISPIGKEAYKESNLLEIIEQYLKYIRENLEDSAYDRLMNVKIVNPDLYIKAIYVLYQMKATGRLRDRINDTKMKSFLLSLLPKRRETKIIRK